MKRITSLAMALLICVSLCVPVFAVDSALDVRSESHAMALPNPGAQPQAVKTLKNINVNMLDGYTVKVTPDKGTNLKLVGKAMDNDVKLEVYKNGGWWPSKTVTLYENAESKSYDLITNCNGEEYTLVFTTGGSATVIGYVCQTDVI